MFQRYLEQKALESIERTRYEDPSMKERQFQLHHQDCALGTYESGGVVYAKAVLMPSGTAQLLSIICRDQGITPAIARELVGHNLRAVAAVLISKVHSDPKVLAAALATLGLPGDYFSTNSPTPHSEAPKTPKQSPECPEIKSDASSTLTDTPTEVPSS